MVDLLEHLKKARRKRWAGKSKAERAKVMSIASKAFWKKLSKTQRSAEMKRRAKVRARKRSAGKTGR
jgi:hypothetical protein